MIAVDALLASAFLAMLAWLFVSSKNTSNRQMVDRMFADRYRICPICGQSPAGHPTWMLAMAIASRTPNRLAELEGHVAAGNWRAAHSIQDFEGLEDEIEYRAIRCPTNGEIYLKKIVARAELWANDSLFEDIRLRSDDQAVIQELAPDEWRPLA